ncbi:MAG: ABC transporter ATP-binding protein [Erysipelotrichaceae bacterium]
MLKIKNLKKNYGDKTVLDDVNIEVLQGEIFGFIGPNGAGKTTTIKSIINIIDYFGEITFNDKNVLDDMLSFKKKLAYLPDNPTLYENISGIEYLKFVGSVYEMDTDLFNKEVEQLAKELEIYDVLGDKISSYSHGMKQKLALISAFMHHPKLLILDEPFVGLDPKASFILKNKMREICNEGSIVFFSSHVLEVVEKLCDHFAVIKKGKIVYSGTMESLKDQSLEQLFLELD